MRNLQNINRKNLPTALLVFLMIFLMVSLLVPHVSGLGESRRSKEFVSTDFRDDFGSPLKKCWFYSTANSPVTIASDNASTGLLFYSDGKAEAIDSQNGFRLWHTDIGGEILFVSSVSEGQVYVVTRPLSDDLENKSGGIYITLRSLNSSDGITKWQAKMSLMKHSESVYAFVFEGKLVLLTREGEYYLVDKISGRVIKHDFLQIELSSIPYPAKDKLFIGTMDKQIIVLAPEDMKLLKTYELDSVATAFFYDQSDVTLYWGDRRGLVASVYVNERQAGKASKPNWKFRNGAEISNIVSAPGGLLITSFDNFAYLVTKKKGELIWKKRFDGRISLKPLITDNYAFVVTNAEPTGYILDLDDGEVVNKVSLASDNFFLFTPVKIGGGFILATLRGLFEYSSAGCGNL